jgi:carbonic anhydrase
MQTLFKYKGIHRSEAVLVACIDFRFWQETATFVKQELGIQDFDLATLPGAAKAINEYKTDEDIAIQCVGIPCELHHSQKIIIINHEDCGAYGGSEKFAGDQEAELQFHIKELKKAQEIVSKKFPQQEVILAYAKLINDKENIEFIKIS